MTDIHDLADELMECVGSTVKFLTDVVADQMNYTPKQRVDAAKLVPALAKVILDRTHPVLTSNTTKTLAINVDLVRKVAETLPKYEAEQLLAATDKLLLLEQGPDEQAATGRVTEAEVIS
jgi:hypothetical protein